MIFRTIAQVSRTLTQAMAPIALFILALVVYTGFVLPIRSMQGWLRWINYVNPVAFAFEALMANESTGENSSARNLRQWVQHIRMLPLLRKHV